MERREGVGRDHHGRGRMDGQPWQGSRAGGEAEVGSGLEEVERRKAWREKGREKEVVREGGCREKEGVA